MNDTMEVRGAICLSATNLSMGMIQFVTESQVHTILLFLDLRSWYATLAPSMRAAHAKQRIEREQRPD